MTFVYILIGIVVVCVALMFWIAHSAPLGYQDETGFHYGEPPEKD